MKYSQLKQVLQEVLNPEQKKEVDTWTKGDNSFSDHMFKDDQHRQSFELEDPRKSDHEDVVKSHIEPHGFSIKDYKSGTAVDKHGRETTIGKALNKVKAPNEIATKFQNDPHRQQKGADGLHVSLSRHPHDVAGMTSEGQSWKDESCMNFCTGIHKDFLPHDVRYGTHIAYLTDKDDHDNSRPLARIALKKHRNIEVKNDHILVPEHRTYGSAPSTFEHTVHRILEKHQPNMDNGIYKKNENVYDDSGHEYYIGKNKIDDALDYNKHQDRNIIDSATFSKHLQPHHIDKLLNHSIVSNISKAKMIANNDVSSGILDKIQSLSGKSEDYNHPKVIREAAAAHKNAQDHHLDKALNDHYTVRMKVAQNPNVKDHHLDKLVNDDEKRVVLSTLQNKNLKDHHLDKIIESDDIRTNHEVSRHKNLNSKHIDNLLSKRTDIDVMGNLLDHNSKKLNSDHIHKMLSSKIYPVIEKAAKHPALTDKHIDNLMNDDNVGPTVKTELANNHNMSPETLKNVIHNPEKYSSKTESKYIVANALGNKNVPNDILEKHLYDESDGKNNKYYKRTIASKNVGLNDDHINYIMNHHDKDIKGSFAMNPLAKKQHLENILNTSSDYLYTSNAKERLEKGDHK